jgi:PTS system mannose-specific IIA component
MVGIIVITHGDLGVAFLQSVSRIYGKMEQVEAVSIHPQDGKEIAHNKLVEAIQRTNTGDGVLILADGFGGSPANLSCEMMPTTHCEIVTGINLNMLMEALCYQERLPLKELAQKSESGAKRGIVYLSELLRSRIQSSQEGSTPS